MNFLIPYVVVSLVGSAWIAADAAPHAADAAPQSRPGVEAPIVRNRVVEGEADYALTLKDPFSPIGYRLPMSELQTSAAEALVVSNVPPPSIDLKAKAKSMLRVRGIIKSRNTFVANINGTIVKAGDEVGVTVDGQTVMFVIRAISLKQVQIEPRE